MKINLPFLTILLLLLPALSFAIGPYKVGDKLINHAQSGLVLRKTASQDGKRIAAVEYGDALTVLKNNEPKKAHQVEEFAGYKIKGFWVKVKTKDGQEGFVFDGYLSTYHVPGKVINDQIGEEASSTAEIYLLGKTSKKGARINIPKVGVQYEHYRQLFKNGAAVEFTGGEGGSAQVISFEKNVTLEEAYLIGKGLWLKGMKLKPSIKKNKITVDSDDELWQITVENKAGYVVLTMGHAD